MQKINFELYKPSELELWISNHYINNGIATPSELTIKNVAGVFNIQVNYYTGPPFAEWEETTNGYSFIFLNDRKHRFDQKNDFFHELCHPLRHVGKQEELPELFQRLQEMQATQFQLIAAMPHYLLQQVSVGVYWDNYIHTLSERFEQPLEFVEQRMRQVLARIEQEKFFQWQHVAEQKGIYNIAR